MTHAFPSLTDARLTDLLSRRVPRYTSYPPATAFTTDVGPERHADWLRAVHPGEAISLYVHIPFCRRLCRFCACRTQAINSEAPLTPYVDTLLRELEMVAERLPPGVLLSHLHFGGGTPTILPPHLLRRLGRAITERFPLTPGAEVAVEIDPTAIDGARMDALAEIGTTRASIGVQDFAPRVQDAIGRHQSLDLTERTARSLRDRGIRGLNLDILYGLPLQTEASFARTISACLAMEPDRLAVFGYAHVPWAAKRQVTINADALPDGRDRLRLQDLAGALFALAGYVPLGIDHFARPDDSLARAAAEGRLHRNFQGYTDDRAETLIGIGASSVGRFRQGYVQNAARTADWSRAVAEGQLPVARGHVLTPEDRTTATLIEMLLCDLALDPQKAVFRTGLSPSDVAARVGHLARNWPDLLQLRADGGLEMREEMRAFTRLVAFDLDRYSASGRFSLAV